MVKVREEQPLDQSGSIDTEAWIARVTASNAYLHADALRRACSWVRAAEKVAGKTQTLWSTTVSP